MEADPRTRDARGGRPLRWVLGGLGLLVAALVVAAWTMSPRPTDPGALVRARLRAAGGTYVRLDGIDPRLQEAIVATEDERFWGHHGIDTLGVARAAVYDVSHLTLQQGASTITEQLAKDLYLGGSDHSPWRKAEDAAMAVRIEAALTKGQILELYLNEVYFGDGAVGVGQASEHYFGVPPSRLTLGEASLLAGLVQAPSYTDPFTHPLAARLRQEEVLTSMVRDGYATSAEALRVLGSPMPLAGGRVLPALPDATVAVGPPVAAFPFEGGLALLLLGVVGFAVARNRRPRLAWRAATLAAISAGLIFMARAFNVA